MQTTEAIPVLEIGGKDILMVKDGKRYSFFDQEELLVQADWSDKWICFLLTTENGCVGDVRQEGDAWVLYEGPLRNRHKFTFGQDNSVIKAAEVIIKKEWAQ